MDILGPDRGKMTIYGSDFQQVNLTPNGGVSPTDDDPLTRQRIFMVNRYIKLNNYEEAKTGIDRYNVLHDGWRSLVCQTTPLKI